MCAHVHKCHGAHVEVRGQLMESILSFPPCVLQRSSSVVARSSYQLGHLTGSGPLRVALSLNKDYVSCLKVSKLQDTYVKKRCFWWVFVSPNSSVLFLMLPNFYSFCPCLTSKVLTSSVKLLPILQGSSQSYVFLKKTCLMSRCSQVPRVYLCSESIGSALTGSSFHSPWLSLHQRTRDSWFCKVAFEANLFQLCTSPIL